MAAYLVLADNGTRAIISNRNDERTGTSFRQKALLTFNTESYLSRDWSLELKSGKKLYFHQNDLGIMDENGASLTSAHTPDTGSGWLVFAVHNPVTEKYFLYAHTQTVYNARSGTSSGGAFLNNISYYQGSTTTTKNWNDWIATWQSQSGYPDFIKYFDGINFDLATGDCEVHWWNNDLNQSAPFFIFYATLSVPNMLYVDITNYLSQEDLSDTPFVGYSVSTNLIGCTPDSENPSTISSTATSTQFKFIPDTNRYFDINSVMISGDGYPSGQPVSFSWNFNTGVLNVHRVSSNITINVGAYSTPYSGGGESEPGAGTPTYDVTPKPIPFQPVPVLGALNAGFVTLYSPNMAQLQSLARYMWAGAFDVNNFKKLFADPMDAILGLSILPLTDEELGCDRSQGETISVGNLPTGVSSPIVKNQYVEVYCGSVHLRGVWGAYLDYSPYTKIQLYLPYIGFVELNPDDCMNTMLTIKYSIDVYSGSCLAQIYSAVLDESVVEDVEIGHVLYEFAGNCASWYPITAGQYQNFIVSGYNIVTGVGMGALQMASGAADLASGVGFAGGAAKMLGGADTAIRSLANNALATVKPVIQRSGGPGGSSFMMGHQYPYLIITVPRMIIPGKQNEMIGYPSYVTRVLGDLNGFTSVESVHIKGIEATREEIEEISELLKNGVFL